MADITINGITIDPAAPAPAGMAVPNLAALNAQHTNYILVQTKHPLTAAEKGALSNAGATILEYAPLNTYVSQYSPADLGPIRALPFVNWAGPYLRGFKVAASLTAIPASRMPLAVAFGPPSPVMDAAPRTIDVVFHRDVDAVAATKKVAVVAGLDPTDVNPSGNKVRLTVQASRLDRVAALDEVRSIEPVFPSQLHNDVARRILGISSPNPGVLPFAGAGQVVAVADTGFDKGSTTNVHPAFTGRVLKLYALGRPGKSNDPHGHGTHVAGSILGDGNAAAFGAHVQGTAPLARLVLQSVLDANGGLSGLPANLRDLFVTPYTSDGVRVHSNSWGSTVGDSRYDTQAFEVDDFVWNNRDCVICFSAGNAGTDADGDGIVDPMSLTPPGTAKNCITVGATENDRPGLGLTYGSGWPGDFPSNPIATDDVANDPNGMVAFSSRGPTRDQRFKPDLVAPGTFVLSARSRDTAGTAWGLPPGETLYMYDGGTSMANPLVAGCAALVREYLITVKHVPTPSAALVKALLINGATPIAGQYHPSETSSPPNFSTGFGRVDMQATLGSGAGQVVTIQDEGRKLHTNDVDQLDLVVPAGATELKATLVWTDPAGETLQNDLDLIVQVGGQERHGNVAAGSANFDRLNNVEQVVWSGISAGPVRVVVQAFRITLLPQSYALVIRIR